MARSNLRAAAGVGPALIRNPQQIRALASGMRQEIVDTLESLGGEASVADIATQLGRSADGLYYHLRKLVRVGLLEELSENGGERGRRFRTIAPAGRRLRLEYGATPARKRSIGRVATTLLRVAGRDFQTALTDGTGVTEGPQRDLWAGRAKGWVSPQDLAEINQLIERLQTLLQQPRSEARDRLLSFAWVIAPVNAQPVRRGE